MTWYWWTHWFWITALSGKKKFNFCVRLLNLLNIFVLAPIICFPFAEVGTSPASPYSNGKTYGKREPLQFPIAVQSDTDDIFDGREVIEASFKDDWFNHNLPSLSANPNLDKLPTIIDSFSPNKNTTLKELSTTKSPLNTTNEKPSTAQIEANVTQT